MAQPFVARGLTVLTFDMPGEGELAANGAATDRFEQIMDTVLAYLMAETIITTDTPIGIFGTSSGAYFALRAAALNAHITACISVGGYASATAFLELAPKNREMVATLVGIEDPAAITDPNAFFQPLTTLPRAVTCPTLLIHGGNDHLVAIEQFEQLQAWVQGETDSWLLPTSGHVCYDRFEELLPLSADWMAARLGVGTAINPAIMNDTL